MKILTVLLCFILIFSGCAASPSGYEQLSSNEDVSSEESLISSESSQAESSSEIESSQIETSSEESKEEKEESFVSLLSASQNTDCIIAVRANGIYATVSLHKKIDGLWSCLLSTEGFVGSNGIGKPHEGSMTTPQGVFKAGKAFGVSDNPGCSREYTKVDDTHYWVDDIYSPYYNQFVSTNDVEKEWYSAEHLIDYPVAYAYCLDTGYNPDCIAGEGSAMFLHCSLGEATAGCIAISQSDMIYILQNITDSTLFVIANEEDFFSF